MPKATAARAADSASLPGPARRGHRCSVPLEISRIYCGLLLSVACQRARCGSRHHAPLSRSRAHHHSIAHSQRHSCHFRYSSTSLTGAERIRSLRRSVICVVVSTRALLCCCVLCPKLLRSVLELMARCALCFCVNVY